MIPKEKAFSKLQSLHEQAQTIAISHEITAHAIYQVMEEYDKNPLLEPVGRIIQEQQESDLAPLRNARKRITEELDGVFQQLKNWHNGAKEYDVSEELIIFEEMAKLPIESGLVTPNGQYQTLKRALIFLHRKYPIATKTLIPQFAIMNQSGEIDHFIFGPSLNIWNTEENKIHNIKKSRVWYAWWELCSAYKKHDPMIFAQDVATYQYYLRIIFQFTITHEANISQHNKPKKKEFLSFNEETGVLSIPGYNDIIFTSENQKKFIGLFFPAGIPLQESIHRDDIFDDVLRTEADSDGHTRKNKDAIYALKEIINQNIKEATNSSMPVFFIIKTRGNIAINPEL